MGSTPVTGRSVPSSPSSPRNARSLPGAGSLPCAAMMPTNTGRSYTGPVLRTSAGARLMVMRLAGHS